MNDLLIALGIIIAVLAMGSFLREQIGSYIERLHGEVMRELSTLRHDLEDLKGRLGPEAPALQEDRDAAHFHAEREQWEWMRAHRLENTSVREKPPVEGHTER